MDTHYRHTRGLVVVQCNPIQQLTENIIYIYKIDTICITNKNTLHSGLVAAVTIHFSTD